jgi:hypothetical protein
MLFRKQVWCWKSLLTIFAKQWTIWLFGNWANASQKCFWFGIVLKNLGYEPTG